MAGIASGVGRHMSRRHRRRDHARAGSVTSFTRFGCALENAFDVTSLAGSALMGGIQRVTTGIEMIKFRGAALSKREPASHERANH